MIIFRLVPKFKSECITSNKRNKRVLVTVLVIIGCECLPSTLTEKIFIFKLKMLILVKIFSFYDKGVTAKLCDKSIKAAFLG